MQQMTRNRYVFFPLVIMRNKEQRSSDIETRIKGKQLMSLRVPKLGIYRKKIKPIKKKNFK